MKPFLAIIVLVLLGWAALKFAENATHHPHFENQGKYGPWTGATK